MKGKREGDWDEGEKGGGLGERKKGGGLGEREKGRKIFAPATIQDIKGC